MADLKDMRKKIDFVDEQILRLLADRVKICEDIGSAKKLQGLPVKDLAREKLLHQRIRDQAEKLGIDPVLVEAVYREIVNMCSSVQE
jgi:chorismate mutase